MTSTQELRAAYKVLRRQKKRREWANKIGFAAGLYGLNAAVGGYALMLLAPLGLFGAPATHPGYWRSAAATFLIGVLVRSVLPARSSSRTES